MKEPKNLKLIFIFIFYYKKLKIFNINIFLNILKYYFLNFSLFFDVMMGVLAFTPIFTHDNRR